MVIVLVPTFKLIAWVAEPDAAVIVYAFSSSGMLRGVSFLPSAKCIINSAKIVITKKPVVTGINVLL